MGYEIPIRKGKLTLEAHPGLEVGVVLTAPYEFFQMMTGLAAGLGSESDGLQRFGDEFIEYWNITSKGDPIPATGDGLRKLPPDMVIGILGAWLRAMREPDAPLGQESSNGLNSPEEPTTEPAN